ncbi:MAG: hypothetical protein WA885_05405 [Phormidesmis sp.]
MTFYRDRADGLIHAVAFSVVEDGVAVTNVKRHGSKPADFG